MDPFCRKTHMFARSQVLTLITSLYTCIYSQVHVCYITNTLYMNRCCANLRISVPLRALTLSTSCIYTYLHKYTCIKLLILLYMNQSIATRICLCLYGCSPLKALCIHAFIYIYIYIHKSTYIMLYIYVYMKPCCANSRMSLPLRWLTLRTSLYTYICSQVYI